MNKLKDNVKVTLTLDAADYASALESASAKLKAIINSAQADCDRTLQQATEEVVASAKVMPSEQKIGGK